MTHIFNYVLTRMLVRGLLHNPQFTSLSRPRPAAIMWRADSQWERRGFFRASGAVCTTGGDSTSTLASLPSCFFYFCCCFCYSRLFFWCHTVDPNHTSAQGKWQNCMYEVFVPVNSGAQTHEMMCTRARNCSEPQSQLRASRNNTIYINNVEFISCTFSNNNQNRLFVRPHSIQFKARDSQSHIQTKTEELADDILISWNISRNLPSICDANVWQEVSFVTIWVDEVTLKVELTIKSSLCFPETILLFLCFPCRFPSLTTAHETADAGGGAWSELTAAAA